MTHTPLQQPNTREQLIFNQNGLSVTFIPTAESSDWVVPTELVVGIRACDIILKHCEWQGHSLPVFSLLAEGAKPESLVVLEGSQDDQRIALLIQGSLRQQQIKMTDIKDIETSSLATASGRQNYSYQHVTIGEKTYVVPDLQRLSAQLAKRH